VVRTPAPPKVEAPQPSAPVDLPSAGVSKLVIHPTVSPANQIVVEWNALRRDASVACREDAYNLVSFDTGDPDGIAKGSHERVWIPDPFATAPTACEVRFYNEHHQIIGRACYQHGAVTPSDCPGAALPPPKMPDELDAKLLNVEGASLHVEGKGVSLRALMTLAASLRGRHLAFALRCDGVDGHAITDTTHLAQLDAGDTVFVRELPFDMAKALPKSPPDACELRVTDGGKLVGRYCIAEGSTNPGACPK
jgi:hypothetical protein